MAATPQLGEARWVCAGKHLVYLLVVNLSWANHLLAVHPYGWAGLLLGHGDVA